MATANSQINATDADGTEVALASQLVSGKQYPAHSLADASGNILDPATSTLQTAGNVLIGAVNETAPASDTASSGLNGRLQRIAQRVTSLIALLPTALGQTTMAASFPVTIASNQAEVPVRTSDGILTVSTDITRPADTTAYAAGDALSDSTSSPTTGGFTLTGAVRASGKSAILTDLLVMSSNPAATPLQGEVWIFDSAVTAINDNAAFAISDAEVKTLVGRVPFTMVQGANNNAVHVMALNIGVTTVGSANLRFLIRVTNAYTPASGEVITVRGKFAPVN